MLDRKVADGAKAEAMGADRSAMRANFMLLCIEVCLEELSCCSLICALFT